MKKYSFFIYHKEYDIFLKNLQNLGVLHVIEKENVISNDIDEKYQFIIRIDSIIKELEKRKVEKSDSHPSYTNGLEIIDEITKKQKQLTELEQELDLAKKELNNISPWGDFSLETLNKLNDFGIFLRFFTVPKKKFDAKKLANYDFEVISENKNRINFIIIQKKESKQLDIDAEEVKQPKNCFSKTKKNLEEIEEKIKNINKDLDHYSATSIPLIKQERDAISEQLKYHRVVASTFSDENEKMKMLEGWASENKKEQIDSFLKENDIVYIVEEAGENDKVPILLKNNRFSSLFEPIGKLFSLPAYSELDLTVFFAPFFMLFFGFCLGDAGYGLLLLTGAAIYKLKAAKEIKPILSLLQILGVATIIFGIISGTFFGINLSKTDFLANYKSMFFDPGNMFNLALVLGALQIVFGIAVKVANQIKQFGFIHSLAALGWLVILVGGGLYAVLTKLGYIATNSILLYSILSLGGFLILFFSDAKMGIPARIGKGVWDIYSTVTGIFGDILSYIRLFALGLSSAILGFVINDIALQILDSSAIIGPIFFVIFLLLGHGLNILISSLGSFVHPMRLTFVEFYKNAGFVGGGKEYKPFSRITKTK